MIEQINEILSNEVEAVLKDGRLSLNLMRIYSVLYMNGAPCRACSQSQRTYYSELQKTGLQKAIIMVNRTCELMPDALHYVRGLGNKHLSNHNITDEEAIICLQNGWLKERHFAKLPVGYKKPEAQKEIEPQSENTPEEEQPKKRGRKPSIDKQ